ncbi:unnamed protein product [Symbiodinium sp. CCMP2456]|nr:unnamed protein product [Symbiodinium sp. CCMP2456]
MVDYDFSGLPCTDNSRVKRGRQFSEGPTGPVFIVWALRLRVYGVLLAVLENVPDMDLETVVGLLSDAYDHWQIFMDMPESGLGGTSRARTYVIFARKGAYKLLHCPVLLTDCIASELQATAVTRPRDFLTASDLEILLEAQEACRTRGITFRPGTTNLQYILNQREQRCVEVLNKRYWSKFKRSPESDRDLCYFLGDNPNFGKWSAASGKIPTLRRNTGKLWFPAVSRWLTAAERLSTLGFPVRTCMAEALGVPPVAVRDPKRAAQFAGNCMSFNTATIIHMVALSCFGFSRRCGD